MVLADGVITALSNFARLPVPDLRPFPLGPFLQEVLETNPLPDHSQVVAMLRAGAGGFLVRGAPPRKLMAALRAAADGDTIFDGTVNGAVLRELMDQVHAANRGQEAMITKRARIRKVLEREGHVVQAAENVDSALEALCANHFDLVVCDYRMPGKTGIDLLLELKHTQASVPVLMVSAYADANIENAMLQLGAVELMKKPIRRKELIDRTARAVGG